MFGGGIKAVLSFLMIYPNPNPKAETLVTEE